MATTIVKSSTKGQDVPRQAIEPSDETYLGRTALRLKALREAAILSQKQAAEAITKAGYEVATSTVYRWEQGVTQPHLEALPAIAKAYGVTARTVLPVS